MYKCSFCDKEFQKLQGKILHEKCCVLNPDVKREQCTFCGKVCNNHNSRINHERLCNENPIHQSSNLAEYVSKIQSGEIKHWAKGQSACSNEIIARITEKVKQTKSTRSYSGWHQTAEAKKKIGEASSRNLSEGYASGRIKSPVGVGRGKYSYFIFREKTYMLRSTWEFIYALYLATNNVQFEVEKIRVPALSVNKYSKTFISDFSYDKNVVEIKGIKTEKDKYIKEAFEAAGYKFIELFEEDILQIKKQLVEQGYDVDSLLEKIYEGHTAKNYFRYVFKTS